MKVFLDLDGVLVDFDGGMQRVHNRKIEHDGLGQRPYKIESVWGITEEEFWEPTRTAAFWSELNWTADGREILTEIEELIGKKNIAILTSPTLDPNCVAGKIQWVIDNIPEYRPRTFVGSRKEMLAHPGVVLIDDTDYKLDRFVKAGGQGILVPRPWNRNWSIEEAPVYYISRLLNEMME
jgi:5'(3')-deoxyribonucleotidase